MRIASLIFSLFLIGSQQAMAQQSGDYRSAATGNWNSLSTWERYNGSSWLTPTGAQGTPTTSSGSITIRNLHEVTVTANVSADQLLTEAGSVILINAGQTLTIFNGAATDLDFSGQIKVNGTLDVRNNTTIIAKSGSVLENNGVINPGGGNGSFTMNNGAAYLHIRNGGAIPQLTWSSGSACTISGVTSTMPTASSFNQAFHHFTWNCLGQSANLSFAGNLTNIQGNVTIANTGSSSELHLSTSNNFTLNVTGDFNLQGGKLVLNANSGNGTVNLRGHVNMSGGNLLRGNGNGAIFFNGTGVKTFVQSAGTITGAIPFTISSGAIIDFGSSILNGANASFTAAAGSTVITSHPEGLSSAGNSGSIQVGGLRTYSNAANYEFRGAATGTFSTTSGMVNNLSFNRAAGVTLNRDFVVNGTLNLQNGIVVTGSASITTGAAATISNASSSNYIQGRLNRIYNTAGSKIFPIGKGGQYRPLSLEYITLTGTSTVAAEQFESAMSGSLPANINLFSSRYWELSQTGGTAFTYRLSLDPTGFSLSGVPVILKKDGSTIASHAAGSPNYSNSNAFNTMNGQFTLGSDCSATSAQAGNDQLGLSTCGLSSIQLAANSPSFGSGTWSVLSGAGGTITSTSNPVSEFTGDYGVAYTLRWSVVNGQCTAQDDVEIMFNQNPVVQINNMTGSNQLTCSLTSVHITASGSGSFSWDNGMGISQDIVVTTPALYTVLLTAANGCTDQASIDITQDTSAPVITGGISGPLDVCEYAGTNVPVTYSVLPVAGATGYAWMVPTGVTIVSGQGSNSISVLISSRIGFSNNIIQLSVVKANGCSAQASISVEKFVPFIPASVSGPVNVCDFVAQGTATYSIAAVDRATSYTWTLVGTGMSLVSGQGGTSIQVAFDTSFVRGTVRVTANSNCGRRAPRSLNVTRRLPTSPSAIIGTNNVCSFVGADTILTYYINPALYATTYEWLLPAGVTLISGQGTTSIEVKFSSTYVTSAFQVRSVNACGASGYRKLNVLRPKPSIPGILDIIQLNTCPTRTFSYTVATMPLNANSLVWTVPVGATILSGQGSTSITVQYPNSAVIGMLTVKGINECNTGYARSIRINLPICTQFRQSEESRGSTDIFPITGSKQGEWSFQLFPNPSSSHCMVRMHTGSREQIQIRLMSMDGRVLKQLRTMPDAITQIGSDLGAGTYLVEVTQGANRSVQKWIKI